MGVVSRWRLLTGLYNRRYLEAHLSGLIERIVGGQRHLSVIMFDIDHFKKINDTHGHAAGGETTTSLINRADKALCVSKSKGRNRGMCWSVDGILDPTGASMSDDT